MRMVAFAFVSLVFSATPLLAQDLVLNGGFDDDLSGWDTAGDPNMVVVWSATDAGSSAASGSMRVVNVSAGASNGVTASQCIPVNTGQRYTVTGKVRVPSGAGQSIDNRALVSLRWYGGPDCTTSIGGAATANGSPQSFDVWVSQTLTETARPGARSVEVRTLNTKYPAGGSFIALFDDVTFTSQSIFQNGFD